MFEDKIEANLYKNLIDSIPEPVGIFNKKGIMVKANKEFFNIFNLNNSGEKNIYINKILENPDIQGYRDFIFQTIKNQNKVVIPCVIKRKYSDLIVDTYIQDNEMNGFYIIIKDTSGAKRYSKLYDEENENLIKREQYKFFSHLIGGIAHNIKASVSKCLFGINIIKKISTEELTEESIKKKEKWEGRIKFYLEHIMESIELIQEQTVKTKTTITIKELTEKIEFYKKHFIENNCKLEVSINVDESITINNIETVIGTLLNNAMQSYEDLKKEKKVELSILNKEERVYFIVRDYGKGIPKDVQKVLFKEMITTKGVEGSGIGLYISQLIISNIKNSEKIKFENHIDGTSFNFSIPILSINNNE